MAGCELHAIICDSVKILDKFSRKLKVASCHFRQTEPFTSWSNAAKREIKEVKKDSSRKLFKSGALKRVWDGCLELGFYIRSNTTNLQSGWGRDDQS